MEWYIKVLKNYAVFSGRAQRKEYWMFTLFQIIVSILVVIIDTLVGAWGVFTVLYALAVIIPSIAVGVRRLHDTEKSGWWMFIGFIPLIGSLILLYFFVTDGTPGVNKYGPNPKGVSTEPVEAPVVVNQDFSSEPVSEKVVEESVPEVEQEVIIKEEDVSSEEKPQ